MNLASLLYSIGQWAGIFAFITLGLLIFSGDTARWWDRFLGMDKIIKFQRKFSLVVSFILLLHPLFFILSKGNIASFLIPDFSIIPLVLGIIAFYLFVAVMIASTLYKRVSYRSWQYIHVVTYVLFFFAVYHAVNWGSDSNDLMWLYITLSILVFAGIVFRTNYKLRIRRVGPAEVVSVNGETHDSFSLYIKPKKPMSFKTGQFCFLRLNMNKLHARHPFTIASAPGDNILRFTIKQSGRFTETARGLTPGHPIYVDGPFGIFTPSHEKDIVCIAGGVGITPFMSIIKDRINNNCTKSVTLLYGCRSVDDIIYLNELRAMSYPWLNIVYVLSNISPEQLSSVGSDFGTGKCEAGYISKDILTKYVNNIHGSNYYIYGPEIMKRSVIKTLKDFGVKNSNIVKEDFFW